jgi:hypothetical protein
MPHGLYREEELALPHPAVPLSVFLVVEAALRATWELMLTKPRGTFRLERENEDPTTCELCERLCNEVFNRKIVEGFDRTLFSKPTREPKVTNYNGQTIDKMPDLALDLVDRPPVRVPAQDWLFIECKPVRRGRSIGEHYCKRGVIRFVDGDYAWAMQEALMVGYADEGYTIADKLAPALRKRGSTVRTLTPPIPCPRSQATNWSEPAPPIHLRHLWLKRH